MSKTVVAARRYSLAEIDDLREEVKQSTRYTTHIFAGNTLYPTQKYAEDGRVEELVRTAMMAGITAEDYRKEK